MGGGEYPEEIVVAAIKKRVAEMEEEKLAIELVQTVDAVSISHDSLNRLYAGFVQPRKDCHRHNYSWEDYPKITSAYELGALGMPVGENSLRSAFGMDLFTCYLLPAGADSLVFVLVNKQAPGYTSRVSVAAPGKLDVIVHYSANMQSTEVNMTRNKGERGCFRWFARFQGAAPIEKFHFEENSGRWKLVDVVPEQE
jgi:hypothetical protein